MYRFRCSCLALWTQPKPTRTSRSHAPLQNPKSNDDQSHPLCAVVNLPRFSFVQVWTIFGGEGACGGGGGDDVEALACLCDRTYRLLQAYSLGKGDVEGGGRVEDEFAVGIGDIEEEALAMDSERAIS